MFWFFSMLQFTNTTLLWTKVLCHKSFRDIQRTKVFFKTIPHQFSKSKSCDFLLLVLYLMKFAGSLFMKLLMVPCGASSFRFSPPLVKWTYTWVDNQGAFIAIFKNCCPTLVFTMVPGLVLVHPMGFYLFVL